MNLPDFAKLAEKFYVMEYLGEIDIEHYLFYDQNIKAYTLPVKPQLRYGGARAVPVLCERERRRLLASTLWREYAGPIHYHIPFGAATEPDKVKMLTWLIGEIRPEKITDEARGELQKGLEALTRLAFLNRPPETPETEEPETPEEEGAQSEMLNQFTNRELRLVLLEVAGNAPPVWGTRKAEFVRLIRAARPEITKDEVESLLAESEKPSEPEGAEK